MVPSPCREARGYKILRVALRRLPGRGTQTVDLLLADEVMRHRNVNVCLALAAAAASPLGRAPRRPGSPPPPPPLRGGSVFPRGQDVSCQVSRRAGGGGWPRGAPPRLERAPPRRRRARAECECQRRTRPSPPTAA